MRDLSQATLAGSDGRRHGGRTVSLRQRLESWLSQSNLIMLSFGEESLVRFKCSSIIIYRKHQNLDGRQVLPSFWVWCSHVTFELRQDSSLESVCYFFYVRVTTYNNECFTCGSSSYSRASLSEADSLAAKGICRCSIRQNTAHSCAAPSGMSPSINEVPSTLVIIITLIHTQCIDCSLFSSLSTSLQMCKLTLCPRPHPPTR